MAKWQDEAIEVEAPAWQSQAVAVVDTPYIPLPLPDKAKHTLDVAFQRGVSLGDALNYVGNGGTYEPEPMVSIVADAPITRRPQIPGQPEPIGGIEQLGRIDPKKKLPFVGSMFSIGELAQRHDDLATLRIWAKQRDEAAADLKAMEADIAKLPKESQNDPGFVDLIELERLRNFIPRLEADLIDSPQAERIKAFLAKTAEESTRGLSGMAKFVEGVTELPSFMIEFLATAGVAAAGKKVGQRAASKLLGRFAAKKAGKFTVKSVGWVSGAIFRTAAMPQRVGASFLQRQQQEFELTDKGELLIRGASEAPATSLMKAFGDVFIENLSETAGRGLAVGAGRIARAIPGGGAVANLTGKLRTAIGSAGLKRLETLGYDGFLEEWGEERLGGVLRAVFGIEDFGVKDGNVIERIIASVPNGGDLLVEAGVLAVPFGVGAVVTNLKPSTSPEPFELAEKAISSESTEVARVFGEDAVEEARDSTPDGLANFTDEQIAQTLIDTVVSPEYRAEQAQIANLAAERGISEEQARKALAPTEEAAITPAEGEAAVEGAAEAETVAGEAEIITPTAEAAGEIVAPEAAKAEIVAPEGEFEVRKGIDGGFEINRVDAEGNVLEAGPLFPAFGKGTLSKRLKQAEARAIAEAEKRNVAIRGQGPGAAPPAEVPLGELTPDVPPLGPGLTRAEQAILKEKAGEARIAQAEGEKVGFKAGSKEAILESRAKLQEFRLATNLTDKLRADASEIVKEFVPKEKQGTFINRILAAKTNLRIERLTEAIDLFIDKAIKRQAVRDFRNFAKDISKKYRRGETPLGKLRPDVRDKVLEVFNKFDVAKITEAKRDQLEARDDYIESVAGSVANAFESLEPQGENVIKMPNARLEELKRLHKTHIGELDADDIDFIRSSLEHLISVAERKQDIKERVRAEKVRDQVTKARKEVAVATKDFGTEVEVQGILGVAKKLPVISQATPRTLVHLFAGKDMSASEELISKNLQKGQDATNEKGKEFIFATRKEFGKRDITQRTTNRLNDLETITIGGKTFKTSFDNILAVYMHIRAEGNLRRLLKTKGLNFTTFTRDLKTLGIIKTKNKVRTGRPTLSELRAIVEIVERDNPDLKELANAAFDINFNEQRPAINKASMELYGYEIANERFHWPVSRELPKKVGGKATDISVSIENQGRYQKKTGGIQRINIIPFQNEFMSGLQADAAYAGMTVPMQDTLALVQDEKWQDRMRKSGHSAELDTLITMLMRIQGYSSDRTFIEQAATKVLNNFGKSVLGLRLSGFGVQVASVPASFEVIEPKHFAGFRNFVELPRVPLGTVKEMMDLSPRLWMRWTGRQFSYVTGGVARQHALDTMIFESSPITDKALQHYTWGDQKAISLIYKAAQNKVAEDTDLKRGTREFKQAAIKITEQALDTQPQWDMIHRSELTSSPNVLLRGSVMFQSARLAQYNVLLRAASDLRKGRIGKAEFGRRTSGVVLSNIFVSVVKRLIGFGVKAAAIGILSALSDDPREKKRAMEALKSLPGQEAAKVPFDAVLNLIGLPAFGSLITNIAFESARQLKTKAPRKLRDIRTGNIFADLALDVTSLGADVTKAIAAFEERDTPQGKFKSGPDKGEFKWKRHAKAAATGLAELIAIRYGLPFAAPRSEIGFKVESAQRALKKPKKKRKGRK